MILCEDGYILIENSGDFNYLTTRSRFKYICIKCGKTEYFEQFHKSRMQRYSNFLCRTCSNNSNRDYKEIFDKVKSTNIKKYGCEHPLIDNADTKNKSAQTKLQRYGSEAYTNRDKAKKTMLERYGVSYSGESSELFNKTRLTKLELYGDENYTNYKKSIETQTRLYGGVLNGSEEISKKIQSTNLDRYGVRNVFESEEFQAKSRETMISKYGAPYSMQVDSIREKYCGKYYFSTKKFLEDKKNHPEWKTSKYLYGSDKFDSSWELALWIYAIDHNEDIEREPCKFEYECNGTKHIYIPDFKYNGKLIEIKGDHFFKDNKMICPWDDALNDLYEAKHQCGLSNDVEFWGKDKCSKYIDYVESNYGIKFLPSFKIR